MKTDLSGGFPRGYKTKARAILKAGKEGKPDGTRVIDQEVIGVLNDLIVLDLDSTEKIGVGIDYWIVHGNHDLLPPRNSTGYRIVRTDGTGPITFGYTDVIDPTTHVSLVRQALNDHVSDLMIEYRKSQFQNGPVPCSATGVLIQDFWHSMAARAEPKSGPFMDAFLAGQGWDYLDVELVKNKTTGHGWELANAGLVTKWRVHQTANMGGLEIRYMDRRDRP